MNPSSDFTIFILETTLKAIEISILGGGKIGGFIAKTLADNDKFNVKVFDASAENLRVLSDKYPILKTKQADLSSASAIRAVINDSDFVIGALPGHLGFESLKTVIEARKNTVDVSFFPEDALELNSLARANGVTAIIDCGVMPGYGGMAAVHFKKKLDRCESIRIMVGGLPENRTGVFEYKAPFSPSDVIEEYTRPARLKTNGEIVVKPALSEIELLDFPQVGRLQAFNTDGLRTLLNTLADVPNLSEKTLRYPGHAEKIAMLRDIGLLSETPIRVRKHDATEIAPIELTSRLLIDQWKLNPGDREFTIMRVEANGDKAGSKVSYTMDLFDVTDADTGDSSMARTTGLPAVAATLLLSRGTFDRSGVIPAELLGANPAYFDFITRTLGDRLVRIGFSI